MFLDSPHVEATRETIKSKYGNFTTFCLQFYQKFQKKSLRLFNSIRHKNKHWSTRSQFQNIIYACPFFKCLFSGLIMNWRIGYKQLILPCKLLFMAESASDRLFVHQQAESGIARPLTRGSTWQNQLLMGCSLVGETGFTWQNQPLIDHSQTGRMQVRKSYEWQNQFSQM